MNLKKNIHIASKIKLKHIEHRIKNYPKPYKPAKYLFFIKALLERGWEIKLYEVRVSKYIFAIKNDHVTKIRFSNHKPIKWKEERDDCDYFVGISNFQTSTTDQILKKLLTNEH